MVNGSGEWEIFQEFALCGLHSGIIKNELVFAGTLPTGHLSIYEGAVFVQDIDAVKGFPISVLSHSRAQEFYGVDPGKYTISSMKSVYEFFSKPYRIRIPTPYPVVADRWYGRDIWRFANEMANERSVTRLIYSKEIFAGDW